MKINPRFALVGMACLTLNMACGSKADKTSSSQLKEPSEVQTQSPPKTSEVAKKEQPLDFADAPVAEAVGPAKPPLETPPPVQNPIAESKPVQALPAVEVPQTPSPQVGPHLAADSEEIANSTSLKISFTDLKGLTAISQNKNTAVHRQLEIQTTDSEMVAKLKKLNEENICQITVKGSFHEKDYLQFSNHDMKELDKEEDIYRTTLTFKNANGEISFVCTHTTYNFFVEDFYINLQKWITVYNMEETPVAIKDFVSPRTENRMLNAIKIANLEKFEKIIMSDDRKELYSLFNGDAVDMDTASREVAHGEGLMSCSVPYVVGSLSPDQVFIRVEKGVAEETPSEMKTGTIFAIYRADAENYFAMTCLTKKTSTWLDFMAIGKGVLSFGVLERPEYSKKYDEILAIHKESKAKKQ